MADETIKIETEPAFIQAAYDENNYTYDTKTGNYLSVCYDENSRPFDCASGIPITFANQPSGAPRGGGLEAWLQENLGISTGVALLGVAGLIIVLATVGGRRR